MNWKELYKQKLVTAEEAISHINDGDKVVTSLAAVSLTELKELCMKTTKSSAMFR